MKRILAPFAIAIALLGLSASAEAQYISTLGQTGDSNPPDFIFAGPPSGNCTWVGMPFETDAQSYQLSSVEVSIRNISGTANIGGYLLAADGSYTPVGAINPGGFVPTGTVTGSFSTITFTPTGPTFLSASSKYVFLLSVMNGGLTGDYQWDWTASGNGFTSPSGGSWLMPAEVKTGTFSGPPPANASGISWSTSSADRLTGAVNATAVPEPGSYLPVILVMGLGLAGWRRFRRA